MTFALRPLRVEDESDALAAHAELRGDGFTFLLGWFPGMTFARYVQMLAARSRGEELAPGWVPSTFLVAEVDEAIVGRVSVRHHLNEFLLQEGGHIGYAVRPAHRRRGYATEILRRAIEFVRAKGVTEVLVTCDQDNAASAAVIERLGGVIQDARDGADGVPKLRYWIR